MNFNNMFKSFSSGMKRITTTADVSFKKINKGFNAVSDASKKIEAIGKSFEILGSSIDAISLITESVSNAFVRAIEKMSSALGFAAGLMNTAFGYIVKGVKLTYDAVSTLAKPFLDAAISADDYKARMNILLGSQKEGNALFQQMSLFASKVPFEYDQIMASSVKLSGVMKGGVNEVKEYMPLIADIAAYTGQSIGETTDQIIKMYSSGATSAEIFKNKSVYAMLGFKDGVSYSALEAREILLNSMNLKTNKITGSAQQVGDSWNGMLIRVSNIWTKFLNKVMDTGLFEKLKSNFKLILDQLDKKNLDGTFDKWALAFAKAIATVINFVLDGVDAAIKAIITVLQKFDEIKTSVSNWFNDFSLNKLFKGFNPGKILDIFDFKKLFKGIDLGSLFKGIDLGSLLKGFDFSKILEKSSIGRIFNKIFDTKDISKLFEGIDLGNILKGQDLGDIFKNIDFERISKLLQIKFPEEEQKKIENASKKANSSKSNKKSDNWNFLEKTKNSINLKEKFGITPDKLIQPNTKSDSKGAQKRDKFDNYLDAVDGLYGESNNNETIEQHNKWIADLKDKYQGIFKDAGNEEQFNSIINNFDRVGKAAIENAATFEMFSGQLKGGLDAMAGPLANAFDELSKTGKTSIKELGAALAESLRVYAAQKTAHLLMEAAFHGIMAFVDDKGNHGAKALTALKGAAIMGSFVAGFAANAGMAHDGITDIPKEGTWLLDKGERVVDSKTNQDLKGFLQNNQTSRSNNFTINFHNSNENDVRKSLPALKKTILDVVNGDIINNGQTLKTIKNYA